MKAHFILLAFAVLASSCSTQSPEAEASFPLKEFVYAHDDAFRYEVVETVKGDSWTEYRIKMISGTWLTREEVDQPEWWHWLTMVVPDQLIETESMMFIGGGSTWKEVPQRI